MTKWLEIAWAEQGVKEIPGKDANETILGYYRQAGRTDILSDEVPWCAAFVGSCLASAGIRVDLPKGQELLARSYLKFGTKLDAPRNGAIVVLRRGNDPRFGHVGFVVGVTDRTIAVLGGNQADSVSVAHFNRASVVGYRWPAPAVSPQDLDAAGSRIAAAAKRQKKDAAKTTLPNALPAPVPATPAPTPALDAPISVPPGADGAFPSPADLVNQASATQSMTDTLISFASFVGGKWPWLVLAITLYFGARMAYDAWRIRKWRAEDASTGKTALLGAADTPSARWPEAQDEQEFADELAH